MHFQILRFRQYICTVNDTSSYTTTIPNERGANELPAIQLFNENPPEELLVGGNPLYAEDSQGDDRQTSALVASELAQPRAIDRQLATELAQQRDEQQAEQRTVVQRQHLCCVKHDGTIPEPLQPALHHYITQIQSKMIQNVKSPTEG